MSPPTISVLLPVFDAGPWLDEALRSLRAQTFADFEVLLQDDGSRDDSLAIASRHAAADRRILVETKEHRGIVPALNDASARARGALLVRMDADDVALPERLARLHALAAANPDVGFFSSRVRYVPREAVREGMLRYEAWVNALVTHEEIRRDRFVECPLPHPTWAIRRSVFAALGGYRDGDFPEDYDLFLRACDAGVRFAKDPAVLLHWREGAHRLCRNDDRYALARFFDLKLSHLRPVLREWGRPAAIVGAGRWGKRWGRALHAQGIPLTGYLDVHPRRVGGRIDGIPVLGMDEREGDVAGDSFLLVAIGRPGGREAVRALLRAGGLEEERDFLCVQ